MCLIFRGSHWAMLKLLTYSTCLVWSIPQRSATMVFLLFNILSEILRNMLLNLDFQPHITLSKTLTTIIHVCKTVSLEWTLSFTLYTCPWVVMRALTWYDGDDGGGLDQLVGGASLARAGLALFGRDHVNNEQDDEVYGLGHQCACDHNLRDHKPPCTHKKSFSWDEWINVLSILRNTVHV